MSYLIFDLETLAADCAPDFIDKPATIEPPDLEAITPAGGLKDPAKIAESISKRKVAAIEDYEERQAAEIARYETLLSRAALDWNLSRIAAIGWHVNGEREPQCEVAQTEAEEVGLLRNFWKLTQGRKIVGFSVRTFDLPTLIQRSRLLNVPHPSLSLARYGRGDYVDIRDLLTFEDGRRDYIMPQSLKAFAKRFGIPSLDPTSGKDVAQMVADGDWEGVRAHCLADVDLTRELALRIHCLPTWKAVAA